MFFTEGKKNEERLLKKKLRQRRGSGAVKRKKKDRETMRPRLSQLRGCCVGLQLTN